MISIWRAQSERENQIRTSACRSSSDSSFMTRSASFRNCGGVSVKWLVSRAAYLAKGLVEHSLDRQQFIILLEKLVLQGSIANVYSPTKE